MIYLKGKPRFKYADIADPMNAQVAIKECYPIAAMDLLLQKLSKQLGKPLQNKGLYLPKDGDMKRYAQRIATLSREGYYKFKSRIDGEMVIIDGV